MASIKVYTRRAPVARKKKKHFRKLLITAFIEVEKNVFVSNRRETNND